MSRTKKVVEEVKKLVVREEKEVKEVKTPEVKKESQKVHNEAFYKRHTGAREGVIYE